MLERVLLGLVGLPFLAGAVAAPTHRHDVAFTFQDPAIIESSGLVVQDGLFFTINDSGDSARVFAVDPATGRTVGVTHWSTRMPIDVESLAPAGRGHVWVGDTGGNTVSRDTVLVAKVPVGRGDATVAAATYTLAYPDGDHDAETLMADPTTGRLYLATKNPLGDKLYAAPAHLVAGKPNPLTPIADVLPFATDGAFFPDGHHLVIRSYVTSTVYDFPSLREVATLPLPLQQQGEGIAVDAHDRVFVSTEGIHTDVLQVPLPASVQHLVTPAAGTPGTGPSAAPPGIPHASPSTVETQHEVWPWLVGGVLVVGCVGAFLRAIHRPGVSSDPGRPSSR